MLDFLVYGLLIVIGGVIIAIIGFLLFDKLNISNKAKNYIETILGVGVGFGLIGLAIYVIIYVNLYLGMHGKYTEFFTSDETIKNEKYEKLKQIKLEILNKATFETSHSWKYLDDYNEQVQEEAITKLTQLKAIDKIQKKFIEIGTSGYQNMHVRNQALCSIQDKILYSGVIEDVMSSILSINGKGTFSSRILSYCLTEKSISKSSSLRKEIIYQYNHAGEIVYRDNMRMALKYEEDTRNEYADYLLKRTFSHRFFDIKSIGKYFSKEDLLKVIEALSSRELILGDKHVKEALVDVLKVKNADIIENASEALRKAYKWDDDTLNILASHLSSEDKDIRHEAIHALESFYATDEPSVVSRVIPMLDDKSSWNRELAIKTLKPLFENYSKIKKLDDKKSKLIVKAYNKILELSKYDLDETVRSEASYAVRE